MKKIVAVIVLGISIFLTGCSRTPTGVIKGMTGYRSNKSELTISIKYINSSKLTEESISKCKAKDGNLVLPDNVSFEGINGVYLLEGGYHDFNDKELFAKKFCVTLTGGWEEEKVGSVTMYTNESIPNTYYGFSSRGDLSFGKNIDDEWVESEKEKRVNLYQNASNLKEYLELNKKHEELYRSLCIDDNYEITPYERRVYYCNKKRATEYRYLLDYKGMILSDFSSVDNKKLGKIEPVLSSFKVVYYEDGSVQSIVLSSPFQIKKEIKQNKVVSLQSAVDLVSKKLSGFGKVKISEIRPEYAVYKSMGTSTSVKARPVYTFRVRTTEKNEKDAFAYFSIRVDMVTGEITDDLGVNGLKIAK